MPFHLAPHSWCPRSSPPQGYEFAFAPEIGDASVGSLVVSTCKDSSVDGPGYLSALVSGGVGKGGAVSGCWAVASDCQVARPALCGRVGCQAP